MPHALSEVEGAGFAWVGILIFERQEKFKTPTLTSNSTTLGWGTLEIFSRAEDSAHPKLLAWAARPSAMHDGGAQ